MVHEWRLRRLRPSCRYGLRLLWQATRGGECDPLMIYKIEVQGRGILPYEFATKQAAQDYLAASFFMGKYRIHRMKAAAA